MPSASPGAAAQSAIPGDALYPVKTGLEQTRLSLARDAGVRAEMKMEFAEQRLTEIQKLIEEGRYQEVNDAVLAFESEINSAILELGTLAEVDPTRAAAIAKVITSALTRYAQALSLLAASAPDSVRSEVARALDTTQVAGGLPLVPPASNSNDNDNGVDDNGNGDDDSGNANSNDNGVDDNGNDNGNDDNANDNGADDNGNDNGTDDNGNDNANDNSANGNDDNSNDDGDDDNANSNDDNSNDDNGNDDAAMTAMPTAMTTMAMTTMAMTTTAMTIAAMISGNDNSNGND